MDWWGLPTHLEWALAPDRGALGYQTGSLAARMAFGRLRGPWVHELKPSSPADCPQVGCGNVEAGGQSPGRVPWVTPWGLSVASRIHAVTGLAPPTRVCRLPVYRALTGNLCLKNNFDQSGGLSASRFATEYRKYRNI